MRIQSSVSNGNLSLSVSPSKQKFSLLSNRSDKPIVSEDQLVSELMEGIPCKFRKTLRRLVDMHEQQMLSFRSQITRLTEQKQALQTHISALQQQVNFKSTLAQNFNRQLLQQANLFSFLNESAGEMDSRYCHQLTVQSGMIKNLHARLDKLSSSFQLTLAAK